MTKNERAPTTSLRRCPGCGNVSGVPFFDVQDVPVDVGRVRSTREAALQTARGEIHLCHCTGCGLVYNAAYDPTLIRFEPGYEVALHHSETFREFIEELAKRLIDRYRLQGRRVLDIGCGRGYFLEVLARLGDVHGVGVDPSVPLEGKLEQGRGTTRLIRDLWSANYQQHIGDLITCQSVFEDIQNPLQFLRELRSMIGEHATPLYLEVFNGWRAFEQLETWSIHYEQCNYFHIESLCQILQRAGFQPVHRGTCYQNDQYLYVEAVPTSDDDQQLSLTSRSAASGALGEFQKIHRQRIDGWNQRFLEWQANAVEVALWGSGGKAVNFLHSVETRNVIRRVVDINPDRQNKYMPGSGQLITPPARLQTDPVEIVVVMNPLYEAEIRQHLVELGVHCDVLVA